MIGQARTGTGKTLAFGVPLLQRIVVPEDRDYVQLSQPGAPQALVVTPTRELASQISSDLAAATTHRHARVLTVYGGVGYQDQLSSLRDGVEVVGERVDHGLPRVGRLGEAVDEDHAHRRMIASGGRAR